MRQKDAEHQSEHTTSDARQHEQAKNDEPVVARDGESSSGEQDSDGESERDEDGEAGGHDDVNGEEAESTDEK